MRRALVVLAALAAGCGSPAAKPSSPEPSGRLVDFSLQPPFVNALDLDPATGDFLMTTNRGFWRIDAAKGDVSQIKGTVVAEGREDSVGTFLEIEAVGGGRLLGSGHPDNADRLPQFLGMLASEDSGRTWRVVSRLGEADLHKIVSAHDRLYAFDAVLGALLISSDGGRTFEEHFTPRGLVIDFVVDPADEDYVLASTEDQLFKTEDAGERWRPVGSGLRQRLAWTPDGTVLRAEQDGTLTASTDRGLTFTALAKVTGEPYKFKTTDDPRHLYLALSDGTILETLDRGKTWKAVFKP